MEFTRRGGQHGMDGHAAASCRACLLAKDFGVVRFHEGWSSEKLSVTLSPDKLPSGIIISPVSASEIIKELPKLSEAERRAVFNKLCELAEGDQRWEEIIDNERPRPKLDAFVEKARAEGSEPLDLSKL